MVYFSIIIVVYFSITIYTPLTELIKYQLTELFPGFHELLAGGGVAKTLEQSEITFSLYRTDLHHLAIGARAHMRRAAQPVDTQTGIGPQLLKEARQCPKKRRFVLKTAHLVVVVAKKV